ncbi:hypothetical protein A0J48_014685 [Sphaerospermopsis aphanizomenoides BCCUSP55]|uniref:hypothetical protein n=1 Tax=Sphaerospermopsis aphanizomenoides TaxID=459663 RepID=UPI001903B1C6|nr:hypothetical protein [Sphaerospermopsis aphanizomenoides]MBK1988768.1 hypothetical protein [Sphaerospermopsis aphanizomenoides BCCUSP55]
MAQPTARTREILELVNQFRLNSAQELSLLINSSNSNVIFEVPGLMIPLNFNKVTTVEV